MFFKLDWCTALITVLNHVQRYTQWEKLFLYEALCSSEKFFFGAELS